MFLLKKYRFIFLVSFFLIHSFGSFAQADCNSPAPFCTGVTNNFPAGTNTSAASGPDYGCLLTQPNPYWYYMQVATSGNIEISIAGTANEDVDFICWGPFSNLGSICNNLTSSNTIDCSYSSSPTETCTISNAVTGQIYMLLITNYANVAQNIEFGSTGSSTGATDCSILGGTMNATICPGGTANIQATTNLTNPSYTWTPGGQHTAAVSVSPTSTTVYTINIAGNMPSTGTPTTQILTATVTVTPPPTVSLTNTGPYCPGSSGTLNANASGAISYTWTGPSFNNTSSTPSISVPNIQNSGTYTVVAESAGGCTSSATTNIQVIPMASVTVNPPISLCPGNSFTLTANAVGATSYSWAGPSGYTSNQQNPVINSLTNAQVGVYTVTAIFGGTATCTSQNTTTVSIGGGTSTFSLAPITVCLGSTASLNSPSGGTSYSWTGPNGFSDSQQNPSISNYSAANDGVYSVSITTSGCVSTGTVLLQSFSQVSYAVIPSDKMFCDGKSATLSAEGQGGTGSYIYNWMPTTGLSNPSSSVTIANPSSSQSYTVTLSDASCPLAPVATTVVNVTVNPTPIISFSVSIPSGCQPFCTEIYSSSNPPSAACSWKLNNGSLTMTSAACSPSLCFVNHGIYDATLSVTDINGCSNSLSQPAFITVFPKPIADFTWIPMPPTIIDNKVHFVDQSVLGTPMTSWSWNFGDFFCPLGQDTSNLQSPYHTYENVGDYDVTLIVQNQYGCLDTVTRKVTVEDDFALYIPNAFSPWVPDGVNDEFMVQGSGFIADSFEMYIYDRWGQLLYKSTDVHKGWDGSFKGQKVKEDVYVYKIKVKDFKGKKHEFVGHITVL